MPIYLDIYRARVDNMHIVSDLASDHSSVNVSITVQTAGKPADAAVVKAFDSDGSEVASAELKLASTPKATTEVSLSSPKLWWPNGQGAQHLYTLKVSLTDSDSHVLDERSQKIWRPDD